MTSTPSVRIRSMPLGVVLVPGSSLWCTRFSVTTTVPGRQSSMMIPRLLSKVSFRAKITGPVCTPPT
jgi:hypothetical protein